MTQTQRDDRPTQKTRPKKGEPIDIRIPTGDEIEDALVKVVTPRGDSNEPRKDKGR